MDIFAELAMMQERIQANQWDAFESHYQSLCASADSEMARCIAGTDLSYYNDRQFDAYCKALKKARSVEARAIYFEYDLDNDWQSSFYICKEYAELEAADDDWACRWVSQVRGSCIPAFTKIYSRTDKFGQTPLAIAITLFLIARTTAALRATVARKSPGTIRICLGFHDQDPIHRL